MTVATSPESSQALLQEQENYQDTWYALNRKMITSVDLLNTDVKDSDGLLHDETDSSRSVFDNLVNEKEMIQFLQQKRPGTLDYTFEASEDDGGLQAIMTHNGKSSTFQVKNADGTVVTNTVTGTDTALKVDSGMAQKLRLIVCTGDVEIGAGVHFQGIIMAKGKITLGAGASLESSPLEAARYFRRRWHQMKICHLRAFSGKVTNMFSEIPIRQTKQQIPDVFQILMIWLIALPMKTGEKSKVEYENV